MTIATKKHLQRRSVLRGLGIAVALPLLDGMVPAFAALRNTAAAPVRRLGAFYIPMGANMAAWTPATEGDGFELSPSLAPLENFREHVLVLTGLNSEEAKIRAGEAGGNHARSQATWLTGVRAKKTDGPDFRVGTSMDQLAAQRVGDATQLASLELGIESGDIVGACDSLYTCVYTSTLAWRTPTTPLPTETNPRMVFERLFGDSDSTDPRARLVRIRHNASILDSVSADLQQLNRQLATPDRTKINEYLEGVRDVERRIQKAEEQSSRQLPVVERPAGVPESYEEHARLMFDLLILAFQTDMTRVATFMLGRELSGRAYPEIGIAEGHHPLSHHGNNPEKLAIQAKLNSFHLKQFAYFIDKMKSTPDGDGSLLDHSMLLYGSGMSNSQAHQMSDLPTLLVGGTGLGWRFGRHLRYPPDTPLTNLQLTLLEKMGVRIEQFGDSTGALHLLSV
jgi:hypothetical protein